MARAGAASPKYKTALRQVLFSLVSFPKKLVRTALYYIALELISAFYQALRHSWDVKYYIHEDSLKLVNDDDAHYVIAMWHYNTLAAAFLSALWGTVPLVSTSREGAFVAKFLVKIGVPTVASNSKTKPLTLRRSVSSMGSNRVIVVPTDGSVGPRFQVKVGTGFLARTTKSPVVPMLLVSDNYGVAKSWDRLIVPKPHSTLHIIMEQPILPTLPLSSQRKRPKQIAGEVEEVLLRMVCTHSNDYLQKHHSDLTLCS